jgi:hypothetical protein
VNSAVAVLTRLVRRHHQLIVTHGNGPQIGTLALESAADRALSRPYPFDARPPAGSPRQQADRLRSAALMTPPRYLPAPRGPPLRRDRGGAGRLQHAPPGQES